MSTRDSLFADALRRIIPKGESRPYGSVLEMMKAWEYETAGIGVWLDQFRFRGHTGGWRGAEFVTYRVPFFDHENEGDWTDGTLMIVRREDDADE